MNIEKLIKDYLYKIGCSACKIYITPDIPEKKMNNAIEYIAKGIPHNYVLAVVDTTLFGSAKEGMVFAGDRIYLRHSENKVFDLIKIQNIEKQSYIDKNKDGEEEIKYNYILNYEGKEEDISSYICGINQDGFVELIQLILENIADSDGQLETSNQICPLAMMSSDIKEKYLKLICNFAYSDDNQVDSNEYAEIMSLIAMNDVEKEIRLVLREYMYNIDCMESNEDLIRYLEETVETGSLEALKLSVMKDTITLFWSKTSSASEAGEWKNCPYIVNLAESLEIDEEQINCIIENIKSNQAIIENRLDDIQIKKTMQELAAKAGAVGIPLAAVYFSGSILGVSAAGMTSGLAALGMGGVLGFSSMFTGIGVAVLLGVGAYKGVKKITGMGALEANKQRELMLVEIAKNSQKALNYLIEDVNEITSQLLDAIRKGKETEIKIQKLSSILATMTQGAKKTSQQVDFAEKEKIICKLPSRIKRDVIEEMAAGATKKEIRELIYSAYSEEKVDETGKKVEDCLNMKLSLDELESVYQALRGIGFYRTSDNTKALVANAAKGLKKGLGRIK